MADRRYPKEGVCMKQKKVTLQIEKFGKSCENCNFCSPTDGLHQGPGPPLSNSMGSSYLWLIDNILREVYARHKEKLRNRF